MILEEFGLPEGVEADRLLAGLSNLIRLRGLETFVAAPILLAEPRYFPEPVEPRAPGVATLLRRLLAYAGLEPIRIDLEIYGDEHDGRLVKHEGEHAGAEAWFMDIADGVYRFGVRENALRNEQSLIGTLGHEVAHAYRYHHRLVVQNRDTEEQLTDLTTVFLGFGAFTLESSYQFRTGGYSPSGERLLYERQTLGYLRPGQLAYLLAAQVVARRPREDLLDSIADCLSDNQAAALREATKQLASDREGLLDTLGLPPASGWPAPRQLEDALEPLPPTKVRVLDRPSARRKRHAVEKFAFRLAGTRAGSGTVVGLIAGFAAAAAIDLQSGFWPLTLGLGLAGWAVGGGIKSPTCTACAHAVTPDATRCKFCSIRLVGDIKVLADVFGAEEAYLARLRGEAAEDALAVQVSCPACDWMPKATSRWSCDCGHTWNTFDTAGQCPACGKQWETTTCLSCHEDSPHHDWYQPDVAQDSAASA